MARQGNTPTKAGTVPPSALPFGREAEQWEPGTRSGNNVSSKPTGKGPRQGNTPHTAVDIDAPPQRHTTNGRVEKTSENWPTREGGKQAKENT